MKKFNLLIAFLLAAGLSLACAETKELVVGRDVVLVLQEKDPRIAYATSLMPIFGPTAAAEYVAASPENFEPDRELVRRANWQTLFNLLEIAGGIMLDINYSSTEETYYDGYVYYRGNPGVFTLLGVLVATLHNRAFGREMAAEAIAYNKALYKEFNWSYPVLKREF